MKQGAFVTFEGIDGCGKSTQLQLAAQALRSRGYEVMTTREPGGTPIAERIRGLVMSAEYDEMVHSCEVLLYLAARAQHVAERVRPALQQGIHVLCDRYQEATFAYQGYGRGMPLEMLRTINRFATDGLEPTLTLIFDVSVEVAHERMYAGGRVADRMEANGTEFHRRIRDGYLALAKAQPLRCVVLDGEREVESLATEVVARIEAHLAERTG